MSHKSFSIIIRAIVKKCLKTSVLGRWLYPFFQKCWRSVVIPMRRKRLQKHGADSLKRLHEVLTTNGILYYCDYGTLLGCIRENAFIKHDDDLDIAIPLFAHRTPQEVLLVLLANGYHYLHGFQYEGDVFEFTVIDKVVGITIDFFFPFAVDEAGECYYYGVYWTPDVAYPMETTNTIRRYTYVNVNSIVAYEIMGVQTFVPSNYEELLVSQYGENWRIPDSKFNSSTGCHNELLPGFAYRLNQYEFLSNKKRILTVGVYDYFHYGHLKIFEQIKEQYRDVYLIVAVQESEFIKLTKPNADIFYETDIRQKLVSALWCVNEVTTYSNITDSIKHVNFDVFAVGEEGKEVVRIRRTPNISSTTIKTHLSSPPPLYNCKWCLEFFYSYFLPSGSLRKAA